MTIRLIFSTMCAGIIGTLIKKIIDSPPTRWTSNEGRECSVRPGDERRMKGALRRELSLIHMYSYMEGHIDSYTLIFMNTQVIIIISFAFYNQRLNPLLLDLLNFNYKSN